MLRPESLGGGNFNVGHRAGFDVLRMFLALEVVFLHAGGQVLGLKEAQFPVHPVQTFVCLSGLLIPQSFGRSHGWGHFAWKRVLRVYPAFFVSLILMAIIVRPESIASSLAIYISMGLWVIGGAANWPLWSLSLEELLYAIHAVTQIRRWWNIWTVSFCAFAGLAAAMIYGWTPAGGILRATTCFFVGNILALQIRRIENLRWEALLAGLVALRVGSLFLNYEGPISILFPLWPMLAVALAYRMPWRFEMPDLSYGSYVYHVPIWIGLTRLKLGGWPLLVGTALATLAVAAMSWYGVEKPFLRLKEFRLRDPGSHVPHRTEIELVRDSEQEEPVIPTPV